jgi:hypothetical protein
MSELDTRALEVAKAACIEIMGPPFGTPEYIAKHSERLIKRRDDAAEAYARAAVTAYLAEAGDGWMPIETLPAEGLYLLASNAGPEHSVHHAGHFFEVWSARSYHAAINPNSTPAQRTLLREAQLVTHWRPLPAPPAAREPRS